MSPPKLTVNVFSPVCPYGGVSVAVVTDIQPFERIWHEALTIECEKEGTARAELVAAPEGVSRSRRSATYGLPETRLLAPVRVVVKLAHVIQMQGSAQPVPPWESEMRVGSADGSYSKDKAESRTGYELLYCDLWR
jgi:hypothetical protein